MSNIPTRSTSVFTPEAVASINRAFAEAVNVIGVAAKHQDLRLRLADYMMSLARNGEVDEQRLCSLSVLAVLGGAAGREGGDVGRHRSNSGG